MGKALPHIPSPRMAEFNIKSFSKGLYQGVDTSLLPLGAASDLHNVDISTGHLKRSGGLTKLYSAACAANIKNLMKYYPSFGTGYILGCTDTAVYKWDTATSAWVSILTGMNGAYYDYIGYQIGTIDFIIFSNGVDGIKKYNGISVTALGEAPATAKAIELQDERVWVISENNKLQYSDDLAPENWTEALDEGGYLLINTWDGETLVGLKSAFGKILVTKKSSMWMIWGTTPENFQLQQVYATKGAVANDTIVFCEGTLLFLSSDGVYSFDGNSVYPFNNDAIQTHIASINKSYVNRATATYFDHKYILSIPTGSSTVNNLTMEYDFEVKAWTVRDDFNVYDYLEYNDHLYVATGNVYVHEYNVGDNLDDIGSTPADAVVASDWTSGVYGTDTPDLTKTLEYLYLTHSGTAGGVIYFDYWIDNQTMQTVTITLAATDTTEEIALSGEGKRIYFRFRNESGANFTIKNPKIKFSLTED